MKPLFSTHEPTSRRPRRRRIGEEKESIRKELAAMSLQEQKRIRIAVAMMQLKYGSYE